MLIIPPDWRVEDRIFDSSGSNFLDRSRAGPRGGCRVIVRGSLSMSNVIVRRKGPARGSSRCSSVGKSRRRGSPSNDHRPFLVSVDLGERLLARAGPGPGRAYFKRKPGESTSTTWRGSFPCAAPRSSLPAALLVFLAGAAGAGIVAPDLGGRADHGGCFHVAGIVKPGSFPLHKTRRLVIPSLRPSISYLATNSTRPSAIVRPALSTRRISRPFQFAYAAPFLGGNAVYVVEPRAQERRRYPISPFTLCAVAGSASATRPSGFRLALQDGAATSGVVSARAAGAAFVHNDPPKSTLYLETDGTDKRRVSRGSKSTAVRRM